MNPNTKNTAINAKFKTKNGKVFSVLFKDTAPIRTGASRARFLSLTLVPNGIFYRPSSTDNNRNFKNFLRVSKETGFYDFNRVCVPFDKIIEIIKETHEYDLPVDWSIDQND